MGPDRVFSRVSVSRELFHVEAIKRPVHRSREDSVPLNLHTSGAHSIHRMLLSF